MTAPPSTMTAKLAAFIKSRFAYNVSLALSGTATMGVGLILLASMLDPIQDRMKREADSNKRLAVATDVMLSEATECARRQANLMYTKNSLIIMVDDLKTMESICRGMERHSAAVYAQNEALMGSAAYAMLEAQRAALNGAHPPSAAEPGTPDTHPTHAKASAPGASASR